MAYTSWKRRLSILASLLVGWQLVAGAPPARAATPTLSVTPSSGTTGTAVTITGSGFDPGAGVLVQFAYASAGSSGGTTMAEAQADSSGAFTLHTLAVPPLAAFVPQGSTQPQCPPATPSQSLVAEEVGAAAVQSAPVSVSFTPWVGFLNAAYQGAQLLGGFFAGPDAFAIPVDASFVLAGCFFTPGASYAVSGPGFGPVTGKVAADGGFATATLTVPQNAPLGLGTISVNDGTHTVSLPVRIFQAALSATPSSVSPGSQVVLSGTGFTPGAQVTITVVSQTTTSALPPVTVASDGTFGTTWSVPTNASGSYTFVASDSYGVYAPSVTVTVGGPASSGVHLVFTGQPPATVTEGVYFPVEVSVVDANGTVDAQANDAIDLALVPPSGGSGQLVGSTVAQAVYGVARFSVAVTGGAGQGYVLQALDASQSSVSAAASNGFGVEAAPPVVVNSVTPGSGPETGGTQVTITGSGFLGATGVTFGGVPAASLQVLSDSQIQAVTPPGSGTVQVQVTGPGGVGVGSFSYYPVGSLVVQVNAPLYGGSLAGSSLIATSISAGQQAEVPVSAPGSYTIAQLKPASDYAVDLVSGSGQILAQANGVEVTAGQATAVTLTPVIPAPATLSVQVRDPAGNPAGGVMLALSDTRGFFIAGQFTAADGTARFDNGLQAGQQVVLAAYVGQLPYVKNGSSQTVTLAPGANSLTLQLSPLPTGTITGHVTDFSNGQPLAGVVVTATSTVPDGRQFNATVTTAANGTYSLTLPAGAVTLQAALPNSSIYQASSPTNLTLPAGGSLTADLTLSGWGMGSVSIQLFTQYAGQPLQGPLPVDWEVAVHFHLSVHNLNAGGWYDGSTYPVPVFGDPGDTVHVCVDGREAQLPSACQDVQLDQSRNAVATFRLIQPGAISGLVVDGATGQPVSGWQGELYSLGPGGQKQAVTTIGGGSPQLSVGVPAPGDYEVDVTTPDGRAGSARATVALGQVAQVGSLALAAPGRFAGQAGNAVTAEPSSAVPGQTVTIRAIFRNAGTTTASGATALLDVPAGTSLVPGTVLVNGQPASATQTGSGLAVALGDLAPGASGSVRYSLALSSDLQAQQLAPAVRVQYGAGQVELLGMAAVKVESVTLAAPGELATNATTVSGRAPAGTPITVYDGPVPLGRTTANAGGFWQLPVTLPVTGYPSYHVLRATGTVSGAAVSSQPVTVHYDPLAPRLLQVCMQQTDGRAVCLDPSQGVARFPYVFGPGVPFQFTLQFDHPDGVTDVRVGLDGSGGGTALATLGSDGLFHATLLPGYDLGGGLYVDYRTRATQAELTQAPPANQAQLQQAIPPWLAGFQLGGASTGSSGTAFSVTVPQADGATGQVQVQLTPGVPYTPSAADEQQVADSGWPVYAFSRSRTDSGDTSTLVVSGLIPEPGLGAALKAAAATQAHSSALQAGLPLANAACCTAAADPTMEQVVFVIKWLNNSKDLYNVVNLGSTATSLRETAVQNWDGESNIQRLNTLYELLNGPGAQYLTPEHFDFYRHQLDDDRTILEGQAVIDGIGTVASFLCGGTVIGNIACGAAISYLTGKGDAANAQDLTQLRDLMLNDIRMDRCAADPSFCGGGGGSTPSGEKVAQFTPIQDPSGYTYEAVPQNRLPGVTATLLQQDPATGAFVPWDAQDYGQQNPQVTDPQGQYAWDVPAGHYQVAFSKDGYASATSQTVTVPPPQTGIDVGLVSQSPPAVQSVTVSPDGAFLDVSFSQYVLASTLTPSTVTVAVYGGGAVSGTVTAENPVTDPHGNALTLDARFTPTTPLKPGQSYTVTTSQLVQNYAGVPMAADDVRTVTVPPAPPQPAVSAVAPAVGPASGGTAVTITGSGFTGATAVKFGNAAASAFTVRSDQVIQATAPAGSGTVDVTVTGPGGTSATSTADRFTYAPLAPPPAPLVQQVNPATGPAAGGTTVTITGSGFTGATAVSFGPNPASSFTVLSDGAITAVAPAGTGTVPVTVTTPSGTGGGASFGYLSTVSVPAPSGGGPVSTPDGTATLLLPAGAAGPGQTVSLNELTPDQLEMPVPAGYRVVGQAVRVDVGAGLAAASTLTLTFDPTQVPPGYTAAIWEDGAWTELPTTLNGNQASAPVSTTGDYAVLASPAPATSGGGGGYTPVPAVTAISPTSGPETGGTTVTVTGSGFTGATAVLFGSTPAASFTVDSDTQITAVAPEGSGTVDVTVTTPAGTSAASAADRFTYTAAQPAPGFPDVPSTYWAYAPIQALVKAGIVNGFPDGTFRPEEPVTRAQFVKMLLLAAGLKPAGAGATAFQDVPASAWYAPYVAAAVQAGIVQGLTPTTFGPDQTITREQTAVLLVRALKLTGTTTLNFTDEDNIDAWAQSAVQAAVAAGYLHGFPDGTFRPQEPVTRAQAAKVLALALAHGMH